MIIGYFIPGKSPDRQRLGASKQGKNLKIYYTTFWKQLQMKQRNTTSCNNSSKYQLMAKELQICMNTIRHTLTREP